MVKVKSVAKYGRLAESRRGDPILTSQRSLVFSVVTCVSSVEFLISDYVV